jgi:hypothetical protein
MWRKGTQPYRYIKPPECRLPWLITQHCKNNRMQVKHYLINFSQKRKNLSIRRNSGSRAVCARPVCDSRNCFFRRAAQSVFQSRGKAPRQAASEPPTRPAPLTRARRAVRWSLGGQGVAQALLRRALTGMSNGCGVTPRMKHCPHFVRGYATRETFPDRISATGTSCAAPSATIV